MEKIALLLPPKQRGVRWASLAIFFLDLGLGEVCSGDAWNLPSEGTGVGFFPAGQSSRRGWCAGTSPFNSLHACAQMDRHSCVTPRPHHTHHNHHNHHKSTWLLTCPFLCKSIGVGRKLRRFRSCCLMASGNRSWHRSTDHGGNPHGVQPVPGQVAAYRRDELLVGFFRALHTGAGSVVVSTGTRPP